MVYHIKIRTNHFITETHCKKHLLFPDNPGFQDNKDKRNLRLIKITFAADLMDL